MNWRWFVPSFPPERLKFSGDRIWPDNFWSWLRANLAWHLTIILGFGIAIGILVIADWIWRVL